ncbi:unnamed protein product (macronuclear) [Paramecium tetraurelia]|uniref:JmjC domain-containing protein n=1 Tax=Paramecium tetraurelia TaxID=5888 RepID=A0E0B3_PARTE|nr:uncharacterized protein GSPATT00021898001 [Paramecium tetraurelia]CAK88730.1 unnamed protein product [Paramecium tetraurelia]|eukprot:XP_001456127.1 hypothetical protein (macronuclear) [Paramecium tetraurelia strain d4-2]
MNLFAEFVNLHYSPSAEQQKLLDEFNIENLTKPINEQVNPSKFKELQDYYLDSFNSTQPPKIKDTLNRFHLPISDWVDQPLFLWEIPQDVMDQLNRGYFRLQNIKLNHGSESIIVTQQLKPSQDNIEKSSFSMTLSKYLDYIRDASDFFRKNKQYNAHKLLSLFDLQIEGWEEEANKLYEYLPQCFLKEDGLSFLRSKIKNVNQLSLNIMTQGSWKGAKQEPGAVNLLNLNNGPGDCLWIVINPEHMEKLFQNEKHFINQEGNYYLKREILKKHGIPYKRFIQKPGDLIILGAGSFYQIECLSTTITTGWSFLAMNSYSYQQMMRRQQINIKYQIQSILPLKNLFLDIFIHHQNEQLRIYLKEFLSQELGLISDLQKQKKIQSLTTNYSMRQHCFCEECKEEVFLCCYQNQQKVVCLKCDKVKYYQVQCKYNTNILQLILSSQDHLNCSYHYCSQSEPQNPKCTAKFKQQKQQNITSPQSVEESSTSNIENVLRFKSYIKEEEKESNQYQQKQVKKQGRKQNQEQKNEVKIEQVDPIKEFNHNKPKINKAKEVFESKQKQNQKPGSVVDDQNKVIQIVNEPPNLKTYAITTRKRLSLLEIKRDQEIKNKKQLTSKPIRKSEKQKHKFTSIYQKVRLSEEEMNEILGLQTQQTQERIYKKGEKMLTL